MSAYTVTCEIFKRGASYDDQRPRIYDLAVEDIEYLRQGDQPLLARLSDPAAKGRSRLSANCMAGPGIWGTACKTLTSTNN